MATESGDAECTPTPVPNPAGLPEHTAVRIAEDADEEFGGQTAFIVRNEGSDSITTDGDVPEGWVEVLFDPMAAARKIHVELFRGDDIVQVYC